MFPHIDEELLKSFIEQSKGNTDKLFRKLFHLSNPPSRTDPNIQIIDLTGEEEPPKRNTTGKLSLPKRPARNWNDNSLDDEISSHDVKEIREVPTLLSLCINFIANNWITFLE